MAVLANRRVWIPATQDDRALVANHLAAILESQPFRHSKRYPALLKHCVQISLERDLARLRERRLGFELFDRPEDYDTAADPIVRVTAAEVRRRLAQFYDGEGAGAQLCFELPAGSYVVHFFQSETPDSSPVPKPAEPDAGRPSKSNPIPNSKPFPGQYASGLPVHAVANKQTMSRYWIWLLVTGATLTTVLLASLYINVSKMSPFWTDLSSGAPTIAVLGQLPSTGQPPGDEPLGGDIFRPSESVSVEGASSAVSICSELARTGGSCRVREAANINLSDLQGRPAILIGAYNNTWALRITGELPYKFGPLTCKCIEDSRTGKTVGTVDFSLPRSKVAVDYSIVSRFHSQVTDGPVLVVAGVAPMSTQAAAEFVTSRSRLEDALHTAPKGWQGQNVEFVLATEIVNGVPGHTRIVQSAFW